MGEANRTDHGMELGIKILAEVASRQLLPLNGRFLKPNGSAPSIGPFRQAQGHAWVTFLEGLLLPLG